MKMQDHLKTAGYLLLALLLVTMALPAHGEETSQATAPEKSGEKSTQAPAAQETSKTEPASAPASQVIVPPESTTPPRGLKLVGNHWTPYQPPDPESFPEGAQVHIIVKGDTLWGLAASQFQNPWLWPQIWNENRYILDSHWIYPGDPILLPPRPTVVSEIVPGDHPTGSPAQTPPEEPQETGPAVAMNQAPPEQEGESEMPSEGPSAAADHSDLYCTGEIRGDYQKTELYIANSEDQKVGLTTGDLVYLNGGREGGKVAPGQSFLIIAKESEVFHPVTGKWVGTYVRRLGKVKVLAVQDQTSIAEITESCQDRIEVGFEVEPDRELTAPIAKDVPFNKLDVEPSGKPNGYVVHLQDGVNGVLTGSMVDVDLGTRDGVHPGDVMLIYLNNKPPRERDVTYDYRWGDRRYQSQQLRNEDRHQLFPRKPIGQLVVISASERTSSGKITHAIRDVEVGSSVELR